jgi:acyl-coenzyme A synthetase/AMP-(fatty) acid ligase
MRTGDLGWADRQGRLWIVGRVARTVHSRFGPVFDGAAAGVFEAHPSVRRCSLVGLGKFGQQEPLLVVEPVDGAWPKDDATRASLERDILKLGSGQALTRDVRRILFVKRMPSDGRSGSIPRASALEALATKDS